MINNLHKRTPLPINISWPPPQGWRKLLLHRIRSNFLPPCGGGLRWGVLICTLIILSPFPATAHAFGQRYDLPLPLWMFIWGGAAAVVLSFVIMAIFMRHTPKLGDYPRFDLLKNPLGKFLIHPMTTGILRLLFTGLFILIVAAGFWGHESPLNNISVVMVWVIAWVGLAFVCSLLGNFWAVINPWNALFGYAETGFKKITNSELSRHTPYPAALGYWPAFAFFLSYAWLEINWAGASTPSSVATALSIYTVLT